MSNNLFAVLDVDEDSKKQTSKAWLTIGASFDDSSLNKKPTKTEKTSQNATKEEKSFFNVAQRKTAADLMSSDESEDSETEKKKAKKKKKHKKAKNQLKVKKRI